LTAEAQLLTPGVCEPASGGPLGLRPVTVTGSNLTVPRAPLVHSRSDDPRTFSPDLSELGRASLQEVELPSGFAAEIRTPSAEALTPAGRGAMPPGQSMGGPTTSMPYFLDSAMTWFTS
jgi:hypothetical protein